MIDFQSLPKLDDWLIQELSTPHQRTANTDAVPNAFMSEGRRNVDLTRIAGFLRRTFACDEAALFQTLSAVNGNQPLPLSLNEVQGIARSIGNRAGGVTPGLQDLPLARFVAEELQAECRYVPEWGWLTYVPPSWRQDIGAVRTRERVARVLETLLEACRCGTDPDLIKSARAIQSAGKVNAIMSIIAGDPGLLSDAAAFDAESGLLNLTNGTLDLETGELRDHDPRDLMTKTANVVFNPVAKCPNFDKLLNDVLPEDHQRFVLRLFGYTLLGTPTEQVFAIFHGTGANGKSTLINSVAFLLGDYAANVEPSSFIRQKNERVRHDLARTRGARLVSTSELAAGEILDAALVKRFTGGDTITARAMYKELFEFKPEFVVFMTTNALPVIDGADAALARRIALVPFRNVVAAELRDAALSENLKLEVPGILNRLLQGLDDYRKKKGLAVPESLRAEAAKYTESSDMIAAFLEDEYESVEGGRVGAQELYFNYKLWCVMRGLRPLSLPQFKPEMVKKLGQQPHKTNEGTFWTGLRRRKTNS